MSNHKLTKKEAYALITSIIDDETDEDTRVAFFEYLEHDPEIRKEFESAKRLKTLISTRCPYYKAPDTLRIRVEKFLADDKKKYEQDTSDPIAEKEELVLDLPSRISHPNDAEDPETGNNDARSDTSASSPSTWVNWGYAAAASLLVILAFWGLIYNNQPVSETYSMEEHVYRHFDNHDGQLVEPTISTASLADAEIQLSNMFGEKIIIPPLEKAEFKGVVYDEFVPEFSSPMFEYYLPGEEQYVYVFAFSLEDLQKFERISRDQQAVKSCINKDDFYIKNVNGKHVLSWRWDGVWYAAISNHDGRTLASLIKPLNYPSAPGSH